MVGIEKLYLKAIVEIEGKKKLEDHKLEEENKQRNKTAKF